MKRFPFVKQHDAMDCGPVCLGMISRFYGKKYSLTFLKERSFITRGEYTNLLEVFNLKGKEYKKFMNFLNVHKLRD